MRNHLCCSALVLLAVFGCGETAAVQCRRGEGGVCLQCPPGQEPSEPCGQIQSPAEEAKCQPCPPGSFSGAVDAELCRTHTSCQTLGRTVAVSGTLTSDAVCGDCLPGFFLIQISLPDEGQNTTQSHCVKTELRVRKVRTVENGLSSGAGGPANSTVVRSAEEKTAEYAVFALVPIFCIMGLLGILICNILKKKGYNCTGEKEGRDEETATPQKEGNSCPYISDDLNEDTISVLVRLITEKKENAAALEEMLLEYEGKQMSKGSSIKFPMLSPLSTLRPVPKSCPHQSHLHTISGLSGLAPKHGYRCSRCAQRKWPPFSSLPGFLQRPTETPTKASFCPPWTLLLTSRRTPFWGLRMDTHRTQAAVVAKTVQSNVDISDGREKKEGEVLSVGRFQVAQIPEYRPVTIETKASSQEQRNSLFGGKHFSSCSSSGFKR